MIFFALELQSFKLGLLGIVALYALMFALPVSFLLGVPLLAFLPRFLPFDALTCLTAGAAWQAIAGFSAALTPNLDAGLKYRYFRRLRRRRLPPRSVAKLRQVGEMKRAGRHSPRSFFCLVKMSA
jgi:hypothetical protein